MADEEKNQVYLPVEKNQETWQLKKAVEAIAIRPTKGKITMLIRRTFNVLLHTAIEQNFDNREIFKIPLSKLISNVAPGSRDYETLKLYIKKMNATQVEWNSTSGDGSENWGISSLLAEAEIIPSKKEGIMLEFSFAPKIKKRLLNPDTYTYINLRFQSILRSNSSLGLYEICCRYTTNPSNVTMRAGWEWWRPILTGVPDDDNDSSPKNLSQYKYFKRDILIPSINEINSLTDIEIQLIEHKFGRRVDEIQFKVTKKAQTNLDLGSGALIDGEILKKLVSLGFTPEGARDIYTENEETVIRACIKKTEDRLKNKTASPLTSASAYFKTLLKDKSIMSLKPMLTNNKLSSTSTPVTKDVKTKIKESYLNHLRKNAFEMFNEANDEAKKDWLTRFEDEFLSTNDQLLKSYKKNGITGKINQSAFVNWLAETTWGMNPTEADLLNYAIESNRFS